MLYQKLTTWQKLPELKKLLDLSSLPKDLFFQGKWDAGLFENCTAVVGSRRITEYGKRIVEKIIPQLVFEKKTVVSGFMYGTDQYAHQICLENGGKTIAILGWGIDKKLTGFDAALAEKIVKAGGLLISEWETQLGTNWTFPVRDRIIAALAGEVIVTEAAVQSGSLITARIARRLGREVWAVPGPITSRTSAGTNNLIAEVKAKMWLGQTQQQTLKISDPLLSVLENEALSADEMARKLGKPVSEIGAQLSLSLLSGQVSEKGGKYYLSNAG